MKKKWLLALSGMALLIAFYPAFVWMVERFLEADSYYSHGFLIPFIVGYLIWKDRQTLSLMTESSSRLGLVLVIAGLCVHILVGDVFHVGFVSGLSLIVVLIGLSLYLYGTQITRAVLFPLLFLIFMVPVPKVILIGFSFKLKMMAAAMAAKILALTPLVFERAGSILYLPTGALTVDNECSGINSLISIFMLSVLFAYSMNGRWPKRVAFVGIALPIAVVSNVARIICLTLIAYVYGPVAATHGILHFGAGIVLWIVALFLLFMVWRSFTWISPQNKNTR